jgi:hypothetical protein
MVFRDHQVSRGNQAMTQRYQDQRVLRVTTVPFRDPRESRASRAILDQMVLKDHRVIPVQIQWSQVLMVSQVKMALMGPRVMMVPQVPQVSRVYVDSQVMPVLMVVMA